MASTAGTATITATSVTRSVVRSPRSIPSTSGFPLSLASGGRVGRRPDLVESRQDRIELGLILDESDYRRPVGGLHVTRHQVAGVVLGNLGVEGRLGDRFRDGIRIDVRRHLLVGRDL